VAADLATLAQTPLQGVQRRPASIRSRSSMRVALWAAVRVQHATVSGGPPHIEARAGAHRLLRFSCGPDTVLLV